MWPLVVGRVKRFSSVLLIIKSHQMSPQGYHPNHCITIKSNLLKSKLVQSFKAAVRDFCRPLEDFCVITTMLPAPQYDVWPGVTGPAPPLRLYCCQCVSDAGCSSGTTGSHPQHIRRASICLHNLSATKLTPHSTQTPSEHHLQENNKVIGPEHVTATHPARNEQSHLLIQQYQGKIGVGPQSYLLLQGSPSRKSDADANSA